MLTPLQTQILAKMNAANMKKDSIIITSEINNMEWSDLKTIPWIWPWSLKILYENWIKNTEQLKAVGKDEIKKLISSPLTIKWIFNYLDNSLWV